MKIVIKTPYGEVKGEIREGKCPVTAEKIIAELPLKGRATRWGMEIYFETPVQVGEENSQQDVEVGDIAYWPPGNAFCIFFGETPVSTNKKPRAYSPVNVIGHVDNVEVFKKVGDGDDIRVERI